MRQTLATDHTQAPGTGGPDRHTSWLTTTNPDDTSHVRPVGTVQVDGVRYFNSGPQTRKSRNIAADPQCVLSIATLRFDLVVEGRAVRVTDTSELEPVVEVFRRGGWPAQVDGDALTAEYSAPSAGPPPWWLFRIEPEPCTHSVLMRPAVPPNTPPYNGVRGMDEYRKSWPPFFEWTDQGAQFQLVELDLAAGADVAFAYALLRWGTQAEFDAN